MWDASAGKLSSPVLSLTVGDGKGGDLVMRDLEEEFVINLEIDANLVPKKEEVSTTQCTLMLRNFVNKERKVNADWVHIFQYSVGTSLTSFIRNEK